MDKKITARHIIPAVCYAILFFCFVTLTVLAFTLDFSGRIDLQDTEILGLIFLFFAAAIKGILVLIGVGGATMLLFPLVFSTINIFKQQRSLTIACVVFDALLLLMFFPPFLFSLGNISIPSLVVYGGGTALALTTLITNICTLKKNP